MKTIYQCNAYNLKPNPELIFNSYYSTHNTTDLVSNGSLFSSIPDTVPNLVVNKHRAHWQSVLPFVILKDTSTHIQHIEQVIMLRIQNM